MLQRDNVNPGPKHLVFRDKNRVWIYVPLILIGAILGILSIGKTNTRASGAFQIVNNYLTASILFIVAGLYVATMRKLVFDKTRGQLEKTIQILFFRFTSWIDLGPMTRVSTIYRGDSDWEHYTVVLGGQWQSSFSSKEGI
ncbi:MAG: hypothetical protein FJ308_15350 [Planctomycetes bacterium]|nr:hypothetical protein [Planctomycetota bacterium]